MSARFERNQRAGADVPTSSMADIAFLLLIFFMVTTIFKLEDGLPVTLPKAAAAEQIAREKVAYIWVDRAGRLSINDNIVELKTVGGIMLGKLGANPALIVAFKADQQASYERMADIMEELKKVNATKVSFSADFEPRP
ncbi:MAG: biopolymer transporter ExbD [Gemmatimonadetes bacterium]|nr:biopolymer transporter ExbD [Gemmatimonadota bacterium]